jgi:hypothetical protein
VGIFNYLTRLADGFGLQLDRGTSEAADTGVPLMPCSEPWWPPGGGAGGVGAVSCDTK